MIGIWIGEFVPYPAQPDIFLEIVDRDPADSILFFAPHQDEAVLNTVIARRVKHTRARFVVVRQRGERHLFLSVGGEELLLDPNRMFTPCGAEDSVRGLNESIDVDPAVMEDAVQRAYDLGLFVLDHLSTQASKPTWVAVHNNTDGFDHDGKNGEGTVSSIRYQMRLDFGARFLVDVFHSDQDEDDLFFVTKPSDHEYFGWRGFNSVLQNPEVAVLEDEDDGSLSVLAEKMDVRYVNIEAERFNPDSGKGVDHAFTQTHMLDAVISLLGGLSWQR